MPTVALQHLAKKAKISIDQAELYWAKAGNIVKKEYDVDEEDGKFWALRMGITKKMMGLSEALSFKEFLGEAAVGKKPKYESLEVERAINMLNKYCKNALWMLAENRPIYRGDSDHTVAKKVNGGFAVVDTSATERKSQNTTNWYTVILDNHPARQNFPKRSRSFIASTQEYNSEAYGDIFILIPFDNTKIGLVNKYDMWSTPISLFGNRDDIARMNVFFEKLFAGRVATFDQLVAFDKLVTAGNKDAMKRLEHAVFQSYFGNTRIRKGFLADIFNAYSAEKTGHVAVNTASMPHNYKGELWVGGKVMVIDPIMWFKLRKAFKEQYSK